MTEELNHVFFCKKCRRLRTVYEGYREKSVMPEVNPIFDVITWCCKICKEPIVEVTEMTKKEAV